MYKIAGYTIVKDDDYVSVKLKKSLLRRLTECDLNNTILVESLQKNEVIISDLRTNAESYEKVIYEKKDIIKTMEDKAYKQITEHGKSSADFMKYMSDQQQKERLNKIMLIILSLIMFGLGMVASAT